MPTISIINTKASQALRGQNIKITVDLTTQSAEFAQLQVGQFCDANPGGFIYSIDRYGNTFEICPRQPNTNMSESGSPGYFLDDSNIDIIVN